MNHKVKDKIYSGISMMPQSDFKESVYPLFEEGVVEWIEWTLDLGWGAGGISPWLEELLDTYSKRERLSGHGVQYSPMSSNWTEEHEAWLLNFESELKKRKYVFISEHFGFARAGNFSMAAPMPVPHIENLVFSTAENLKKLEKIANCPVGLENLATQFSVQDVLGQGRFIADILNHLNGCLILDLHNLYCQRVNFNIPLNKLVKTYPLEAVSEIHISGGSYSESKEGHTEKPIRRDTHNGAVPESLFSILPEILPLCPNLRVVILERLGNTFQGDEEKQLFRQEFLKMQEIVENFNRSHAFNRKSSGISIDTGLNGADYHVDEYLTDMYQSMLFELLYEQPTANQVIERITEINEFDSLLPYLKKLEPRMIEVGQELVRKWGVMK